MAAFWRSKRFTGSKNPAQHGTLALERLEDRWAPATFTVLNTNDSGVGSLVAQKDTEGLDELRGEVRVRAECDDGSSGEQTYPRGTVSPPIVLDQLPIGTQCTITEPETGEKPRPLTYRLERLVHRVLAEGPFSDPATATVAVPLIAAGVTRGAIAARSEDAAPADDKRQQPGESQKFSEPLEVAAEIG